MHTCSRIGKSSALKNGLRPTYLNIQGDLINCVILNLYESINLLALIASAPILSVFTHRCESLFMTLCTFLVRCRLDFNLVLNKSTFYELFCTLNVHSKAVS